MVASGSGLVLVGWPFLMRILVPTSHSRHLLYVFIVPETISSPSLLGMRAERCQPSLVEGEWIVYEEASVVRLLCDLGLVTSSLNSSFLLLKKDGSEVLKSPYFLTFSGS